MNANILLLAWEREKREKRNKMRLLQTEKPAYTITLETMRYPNASPYGA